MSDSQTLPTVSQTPTEPITTPWWALFDFSDVIGIATLVVLVVTAFYARSAIKSQTTINQKRAAIDLMIQMKQDQLMVDVYPIINRIHKDTRDSIELYANPDPERTDEKKKEVAKIRYLLNYYETICVGINNGIYDEQIIIDNRYTPMVTTYIFTKRYIETVRQNAGTDSSYEHFENRILEWKERDPERYKKLEG